MRDIPLKDDWGDLRGNLDLQDAYDMFYGKSSGEAESLFRDNVIERCSDLRWMPPIPFQYYILSYRDYIVSGQLDELSKPDAVSCFVELIKSKMQEQPQYVRPVFEELQPTLEMIAENQLSFDADIDIYGDFKETLEEVLELNKIQT